jgi:hypothetical protein
VFSSARPLFSSFILSRTGTWSVRDKIKLEKHGSPIAARLVKMSPIAAAEMYKLCTDFTESAKFNASGTVDDFEMAKSLSHRSPRTMIFLV